MPPVPPMPPPPPPFGQTGSAAAKESTSDAARAEPTTRQPGSENPASDVSDPSPEQERIAILRMIAEGRITPEEGDLLLEALGS